MINTTLDYKKLFDSLYDKLCDLAKFANVTNLGKYFKPCGTSNHLHQLASSLQNSGNMRNSIKYNDPKSNNRCIINSVIDGNSFSDWEDLYEKLIDNGIVDNGSGENKETNWQKYCKGLFNGIKFLKNNPLSTTFTNIDDAIRLVKKIQKSIHGLGFALACDWLKECGCECLAKPDTHTKNVSNYITGKDNDMEVIKFYYDWANKIGETAYKIDKIIWLLCTGDFYLDNISLGRPIVEKIIDSI